MSNEVKKYKLLFLNTVVQQCGIYQYGKNVFNALSASSLEFLDLHYAEILDIGTLNSELVNIRPDVVILNHVRTKNSWVYGCHNPTPTVFIDLLHELSEYQNYQKNDLFKSHLIANPDISNLNLSNDFNPLPRLIPELNKEPYVDTGRVVVGGFSFGTLDRGWLQMIETVRRDIPNALVRFHMPFNGVVDPGGIYHALGTADLCRKRASDLGIELEISHDFLTVPEVISKLGQNTINLHLYQDMTGKGISSATDFGLASKRPFAINSSPMYRHFSDIEPLINVEKTSLSKIIELGTDLLEPYYNKWSKESFSKSFQDTIINIMKAV